MYHFTYKCRLCGVTFVPSTTNNEHTAMFAIMEACDERSTGREIAPHEPHRCLAAGDLGIADLIGAKFTPEK